MFVWCKLILLLSDRKGNYCHYHLTVGEVRAQLALRPRVWAHCTSTGQEVSGVVLQPSHICIHACTYMLTACGVYVVRYPTRSNGLVVHKPTRPSREVPQSVYCVGLREDRRWDWCLWLYCQAKLLFLFECPKTPACMLTYYPTA